MRTKPQWYVVHCYSGYENKVKKNLEHRAESMGMQTHILEVIVPTEEQVELRDGQRRVVERRIYPGYVLVQMILDEESWYVVRNTPGVTGFVGHRQQADAAAPGRSGPDHAAHGGRRAGRAGQGEGRRQGAHRRRIVSDFNGTVDEV